MDKIEPKSKKFPKVIRRSFADCSSSVPMVDFGRYLAPILVYESPMDIMIQSEVCTAVKRIGVHVEKDELLKALKYDRDQYAEGYRAGYGDVRSEWISISERLPENDVPVLCWYLSGNGKYYHTVGSYHRYKHDGLWDTDVDADGCGYGCERVTHWMPLPKPPEVKGDEN